MGLVDASIPVYLTAVSIGLIHGVEPGHGWPVAATFALRSRNRWAYGIGAALILAGAHLVSSFAVVALFALANRAVQFDSFDWIHWVAGALLLLMAVFQWRGGHAHQHNQAHSNEDDDEHDHDHDRSHGNKNGHDHDRSHGNKNGHDHDHDHNHNSHSHENDVQVLAAASHEQSSTDADPPVTTRTLLGLVGFAFALGFVHEEEFAIIALAVGKTSPWLLMATYAAAVSLSLVLLTTIAIATLKRFDRQLRRYHHHLPRISAVFLAAMGVAYLMRLI